MNTPLAQVRTRRSVAALRTLIACAGTLAAASPALAQTAWLNPVNGTWGDGSKWTLGVPGGSSPATLGLAGPYTVSVAAGATVGTLTISNAAASLNIENNITLFVNGDGVNPPSISNSGAILVNPTGGPNLTRVYFNSTGTISGSGRIRLNANSSDINSARLEAAGVGAIVTQTAAHSIVGQGRFYNFTFANAGSVEADQPALALDFLSMNVQNSGALRSTTGNLVFISTAVTQTAPGAISAAGPTAAVLLSNSSVSGGTLTTSGGGIISTATGTSATIEGLTNAGLLHITNNSTLNIGAADVANNATINVNNGVSPNLTRLFFAGAGGLTGTGVVQLNAISGDLNSARIEGPGAAVRTIGAGQVVRGTGIIYNFNPTILGTIDADTSGRTLQLFALTAANQGTLRATAGNLEITSSTINQSGPGVISTSGAGTVTLFGSAVNAGVLNGAGGFIQTATGTTSTLSGVTIQNAFRVTNNSTINTGAANILNNGVISINSGSGVNAARLFMNGAAELQGTGTILLQAVPSDVYSARIEGPGATARTIGAGQTVRGSGVVYNFNPTVAGTINADTVDRTLRIDACNVANVGLLQASAGTLLITGSTITTSGPGQLLASGGAISLFGSTLSGGPLNTSGSGEFNVVTGTSANLQNVAVNGVFKITNNSTANVNANIAVNGTLTVNASAGPNTTRLFINAPGVTIGGSGTVLLNAINTDVYSARIESGAGNAATLGPALTIRGSGVLYNFNPVLQGAIDADTAARQLRLDALTMTNSGQVRATAGQIYITSSTILGSGTIAASGATGSVLLFSSTLSGPTLTTSGAGTITVQSGSSANITGITNAGALNVANNSNLNVTGNITNNGVLTVNDTAGPNTTRLQPSSGVTIAGSGTIRLNATPSDIFSSRIESGAGNVTTFGPLQTIAGRGVIYNHTANIQGTLSPGFGVANYADLNIFGMTASLAPTSTVAIELGGTAPGNFDRLVLTSSSLALSGKLKVTFTGALLQSGSAWTIITGGNLTGDFTSFDLPDLGFGREWVITKTANSYRLLIPCLVADITGVGGPPAQPDGQFTVDDLITFVNEFSTQDGCPGIAPCNPADVCGIGGPPNDPDGELTVDDLIAFVNAFSDGC